jgi:riboflavin kinase/FMN adenylyltransferase
MHISHGFDDAAGLRNGFVSIGNFDGVHRGHQSMIAVLTRHAKTAGAPSVIFTFDPHPIALLRPGQSPPPLSTTERKIELLAQHGVDGVIVYPTDQPLLQLSPREFFDQIVIDRLDVRGLVEGPNFFFGHDRAGNIETLRDFCREAGKVLEIIPPVAVAGLLVSSSEIRRLIAAGQVRQAAGLLGCPYRISGSVVRGAERGRTIGFPTANLEGIRTVLPCDGVYAGRAKSGTTWYAAGINIGPNPTFADQDRKLEVHFIDYAGDLYGARVAVEILDRLRDTVRFGSVAQLQTQLQADIDRARALAKADSPR